MDALLVNDWRQPPVVGPQTTALVAAPRPADVVGSATRAAIACGPAAWAIVDSALGAPWKRLWSTPVWLAARVTPGTEAESVYCHSVYVDQPPIAVGAAAAV